MPQPYKIAARNQLLNEQGNLCAWCGTLVSRREVPGSPMHPTTDHIVPRDAGGSNDPDNLVVMHARCNVEKGRRRLGSWDGKELRRAIRRGATLCQF